MKILPSLVIVAFLGLAPLSAQSPIELKPEDTVGSILKRRSGQVVELRLVSGEKIAGKVEKVGENLVHLSQLTGQEFFEAAVDLESVSAVVVRKAK